MENNIQNLLDKLSRRECSQDELNYLLKIFNGSEDECLLNIFEKDWGEILDNERYVESANKEEREKIWRGIKNRIRQERAKLIFRKTLRYAAIFAGILFITLFAANVFITKNSNEILLIADGKEIVVKQENYLKLVKLGLEYNEGTLTYRHPEIKKEHIIRVPSAKKQRLFLQDGTEVWLNSNSELTLVDSDWTNKNSSNFDRIVNLSGEAYFSVVTTGQKFVVNSGKIKVDVLGTKFVITSFSEVNRVVLEEGSVKVSSIIHNGRYVNLKPGEMAVLKDSNDGFDIEMVNPENYSGWRFDIIVFNDEKFDNILRILEREFNVVIVNKNKELSDKTFTGRFYKGEIEQILDVFITTNDITYTINKSTITIN
jgi:hypothetical protein